MKIIKRNGAEESFDTLKIVNAVQKACNATENAYLAPEQLTDIADYVEYKCNKLGRAVSVEEIQDMVENQLMAIGAFAIAKNYVRYRYDRSLVRKANTTDNRILSLIECNNEEVMQENSNKNPTVNSVQRDYMAGEVSKDLTRRLLLPEDIVEADKQGIIHFHDSDYFAQHMHNCDLVNLEDMLQNGTVISETLIERPHSFSTACNIATQIIAQVASNQYGGQSISLAHLAPFVQVSRVKIRQEVIGEMKDLGIAVTEDQIDKLTEERLRREITKGIQTIQYQVVTLLTTNGQAPFVTVYMYLDEAKNPQEKKDLAMIIEETLKQRYLGVKNEAGVWITPAFPKLIYVLDEDNITPDAPYYYLTELAAKCTAKRMVPDYISAKKMRELGLTGATAALTIHGGPRRMGAHARRTLARPLEQAHCLVPAGQHLVEIVVLGGCVCSCEAGDGARNRTEGDTGRIASLGGLVLSNRGILAGRREFRRFFHLGSLGCHGRSCCRGSHPLLLKPLAFFPLGSLGSAPGLAGLLLGYPPLLAGLGLGGAQTLLLRSRFGAQALLLGPQELLGLAGLLLLLHLRKLLRELLLLAVAAPQLLLRRSHGVAAGAWHVLLVDARDLGRVTGLSGRRRNVT